MRRILLLLCLTLSAPAIAQEHAIAIAGGEELVLSHRDMTCGPAAQGSGRDTSDIPLTAFRRRDGSVVVPLL
jgi:hypothetical protein